MRQDHAIVRAMLSIVLGLAFAFVGHADAADDPKKTPPKEKDDGVEWTKIAGISGKAPATDLGYYTGSQKFSTTEKALRVKVSMSSLQGKGGTAKVNVVREGRPVKKYLNLSVNRPGDVERSFLVEPGDFTVSVVVNNVDITVTVEEGKKKAK